MSTESTFTAFVQALRRASRGRLVTVALTTTVLLMLLQTVVSARVEASLLTKGPKPGQVVTALTKELASFVPPEFLAQLAAQPLSNITAHLYLTVLLPWLALLFATAARVESDGISARRAVALQLAGAIGCVLVTAFVLQAVQVAIARAFVPSAALGERVAGALCSAAFTSFAVLPAVALGAFVTALVRNRLGALAIALPLLVAVRWASPHKLNAVAVTLMPPTFRIQPILVADPLAWRMLVASAIWTLALASAAVFVLRFRALAPSPASTPRPAVAPVPCPSEE